MSFTPVLTTKCRLFNLLQEYVSKFQPDKLVQVGQPTAVGGRIFPVGQVPSAPGQW
jgi:hypothetical protein